MTSYVGILGGVREGFVNRDRELAALEQWWAQPGSRLALLWGRRRVGKTWLLDAFASARPSLVHGAAGRPARAELAQLHASAHVLVASEGDDLLRGSFVDWDDALTGLASLAHRQSLLVAFDEFPELVEQSPELPGVLRSFLDRDQGPHGLRFLLCGSAIRSMRALEEERAPLYGRIDLSLQVHPFAPHEAALMLPRMKASDRALVWGLVGGIPLYLSWWDQAATTTDNLRHLICSAGARLLGEGQLILATETDSGTLTGPVLRSIAAGATKHNEIADAVRADPTRTLDRLVELRLVERVVPVTDDPRRTRRRIYRVADNFLAFWLGVVERYRSEIDRGLGETILPVMVDSLDDALGHPWEEAMRIHLRRLGASGALGPGVVAVGPYWRDGVEEVDAMVLAGRGRKPILLGEAKWTRTVDARRIEASLGHRASQFGPDRIRLAIAARDEVTHASADTLSLTAADIFAAP